MVPSAQEAELEDQELEASLGCIVRPNFKTQKQTKKNGRHIPIISIIISFLIKK